MSRSIRSYPKHEQTAVIERRLKYGRADVQSKTMGLGLAAAIDAEQAVKRPKPEPPKEQQT